MSNIRFDWQKCIPSDLLEIEEKKICWWIDRFISSIELDNKRLVISGISSIFFFYRYLYIFVTFSFQLSHCSNHLSYERYTNCHQKKPTPHIKKKLPVKNKILLNLKVYLKFIFLFGITFIPFRIFSIDFLVFVSKIQHPWNLNEKKNWNENCQYNDFSVDEWTWAEKCQQLKWRLNKAFITFICLVGCCFLFSFYLLTKSSQK